MLYFLTLLAPQTAPVVLHPRIVEVAVYKPGLVYVTREATVPKGQGFFRLDRVPRAIDGSLWYKSPDNATFSELRTTLDLKAPAPSIPLTSIPEVLASNVGKAVTLILANAKGREVIAGTLVRFDPQSPQATLKLSNGNLRAISVSSIVEVPTAGLRTTSSGTVPRVNLEFRIDAAKPSKIQFVSLELGAAWMASYHLDLNGSKSTLRAGASLGLGALALKESRVRLVSGLPTLQGESRLDLMVGGTSLSSFLASSTGDLTFGAAVDPYDALQAQNNNERRINYLSPPDGLYRGSAGGGFAFDTASSVVDLPRFMKEAIEASRLEDLHIYDFGVVSLPAGGRLSRILSKTEAPIQTVYRWDVRQTNDVGGFKRTLRIKNMSKTPWPAGNVFVVSNEIPLAQVPFPFTPPGGEGSLVLGSAEDLIAHYSAQEISRQEVLLRPNLRTAEVVYESVLTATNTRSEPVDVEMTLEASGDLVDAGGAKTSRLGIAGASVPTTRFVWQTTLAPGEKRDFTARYKANLTL